MADKQVGSFFLAGKRSWCVGWLVGWLVGCVVGTHLLAGFHFLIS